MVELAAPVVVLLAYLGASALNAHLFIRLANLPDLSAHGSKNPGAINALRIWGWKWALPLLALDFLKGILPVYIVFLLDLPPPYLGATALAAILGHIYPIFYHFRGGKGVAVSFGTLTLFSWQVAPILAGVWFSGVLLTGYAAFGSILATIAAPLVIWWLKPEDLLPVVAISLLVLLRHRGNLRRLYHGCEEPIFPWALFTRRR